MSQEKPSYEKLEQIILELENKIELNDSFLEMLFDAIPNPIFYKDKEGVYQNCNEAFSKTILGIPKDDIIGKTLYEFPELIPRKNADIYYKKDKELMDSHGTQFYEATVRCSDAQERHYNFYKATFLSKEDEALGIVGVMLDISDYKKALQELDHKNAVLSDLSITDPLTQLYNRRHFQDIFENKFVKLNTNKQKFAFMIIDIDFFKEYNDSFGHHQGDVALEKVSAVLKNFFIRESDYVFRLGGEEFGVLFSFNDIQNAFESAQKVVSNVEDLKLESANKSVSKFLTISAGLGTIDYVDCKCVKSEKVFERVDKLLYQSKNEGRNRLTHEEMKD